MSIARKLGLPIHATPPTPRTPDTSIVYGPFDSRRFGKAIGVNISGRVKACSFNCAYCDLGETNLRLNQIKEHGFLPSVEEIKDALSEAFRSIHQSGPGIDTICLSGNGEPTLHPDFPDVVKTLMEARDAWLSGKPISLLTNGVGLDNRKWVEAANKLEERVVKLDAGNEKLFKIVNAPLSRTNLARIIANIRNLKSVTIQSLFCQGTIDNTKSQDIEDWLEVIAMLKPKSVHIQGVSRVPAKSGVLRCDEDTLHTIASLLERRTGIKAAVTP